MNGRAMGALLLALAGCAGSTADGAIALPLPATRPSARVAVAADPAPAWPRAMRWVGTVGGSLVRLAMVRDGATVRFSSVDAPPLTIEGTIEGMKVELRTTVPPGAPPADGIAAVLEPMNAHAEVASLWAPSREVLLVEDLGPAGGLSTTWHAMRTEEPFVSIDVRWPQIDGPGHAAVNAWLAGTGTAYAAEIRDAGGSLHAQAKAAGLPVDPGDAGGGASLEATAHLVLVTDRFISVHEDHSVWRGEGAHPQNGMACATFERRTGKQLRLADVFAHEARAAVATALEGVELEVTLADDQLDFATRPDAQVCLVRRGVWLEAALPHAVAALDGIAVPYDRLGPALRPGIDPR